MRTIKSDGFRFRGKISILMREGDNNTPETKPQQWEKIFVPLNHPLYTY